MPLVRFKEVLLKLHIEPSNADLDSSMGGIDPPFDVPFRLDGIGEDGISPPTNKSKNH